MNRRRQVEAMRRALEDVYGGDQSLEAEAMMDKLDDRGWRLVVEWPQGMREQSTLPLASTRGLPKRRSAG